LKEIYGNNLNKSISSGVIEPWVVVGASDASVQVESLSGQLLGGQFAPVGGHASLPWLNGTPLLPGFKGTGLINILGVLDPLDNLGHGHKVNIIVVVDDLINPVEEGIEEFWVVLEPSSMEKEAKRSTVLIVVTVEVVGQEIVELITAENV